MTPKKESFSHVSKGKLSEFPHKRSFKRFKRKVWTVSEYIEGIQKRNRVALGKAITLIESKRPDHQQLGQEIIEKCLPLSGSSVRVGITGTPGVGKSTFIESLGTHLIKKENKRLAVLAIDPSSQVSGGSILGDKTRMQELSILEDAFIRPSPAGDSLGGVARKTRESIILCEAAGFDTIFVETVGVGQSETAVHSMVDFFLLLLLPNAGDELQGIKRGVMEMADLVIINKADGDAMAQAKLARKQCRNALHLFPPKASDWVAKAALCSALNKEGLQEIWQMILEFVSLTKENQYFEQHRGQQAQYWLKESISEGLQSLFYQNKEVKEKMKILQTQVLNLQLSPFKASELILKIFTEQFQSK